jgi:TatA/E family protein of Tat protein translocase
MGIESPIHLLFLGAVALIVLGPKRLPELARALGKGIREFRSAFDEAASPQTGGAPVLEREQPTEQLAVAPITAPAGAEQAGAEQAGAERARTEQDGAERAGTERAGSEWAGAESAAAEQPDPVEQGSLGTGPVHRG